MNDSEHINDALSLTRNGVVVMPCFNAGARVRAVATDVLARGIRLIVVDDGSTDGGVAHLEALGARVLRFERNRGKGHALVAGVREALTLPDISVIVLMDADGQHDARELPGLFDSFQSCKTDLLIGARCFDRPHVPWRSRFGNKVTVWVTAHVFGRRLPDTQSGFRLLSPRFADAFVREIPGGRYETEMRMLLLAIRDDYVIASAPIQTIYEAGNSSSHFRKIRDSALIYAALLDHLKGRFHCS